MSTCMAELGRVTKRGSVTVVEMKLCGESANNPVTFECSAGCESATDNVVLCDPCLVRARQMLADEDMVCLVCRAPTVLVS